MAGDEEDPDGENLRKEFMDLMGKSVEEILRDGQKALFADLVGKVRLGLASHQELAILRNVLKDNGLVLGIPPEAVSEDEASLKRPAMDLPSFDAHPAWEQ